MVRLYIATYIVGGNAQISDGAATAKAFAQAQSDGRWPYDVGDDPAFFAAHHHRGPVTWGICRADVRRRIQPGNWAIFFSVKYCENHGGAEYCCVAALKVYRKIRQVDIYSSRQDSLFKQYLNLLVRPNGSGWEHFEPGFSPRHWHKDWLWRICDSKGYRKSAFDEIAAKHRAGEVLRIGSAPAPIGENYVVFHADHTALVARTPVIAARWKRGDQHETWLSDPVTISLRKLTLGMTGGGRHLRTANRLPHRHIVGSLSLPEHEWCEQLRGLMSSADS